MNKNSRILVVGHDDIIENSLTQYLCGEGYTEVFSSTHLNLNVFDQSVVRTFFEKNRPQYVFLGSSRSGGIAANQQYPAKFYYSNIMSQSLIIEAAYRSGTEKLLYFSSSCVYPKGCPQPMKEDYLLTGPLEPTSEAYSVSKIAGIKMCQAYRQQYGFNAIVMVPATLYGLSHPGDQEAAHVMDALIQKFHEAKLNGAPQVEVWGSGQPYREFLFADDFVSASMFLMANYNGLPVINVGCGRDVSIMDLAQMIARCSGFSGEIVFDDTKPDGAAQKLLDSQRMTELGWTPHVGLEDGIRKTLERLKGAVTDG